MFILKKWLSKHISNIKWKSMKKIKYVILKWVTLWVKQDYYIFILYINVYFVKATEICFPSF